MAKTKTYTLTHLATIIRTSTRQAESLMKKLGHPPLETITIGTRKFRAYGQAAVDAATKYRAEKDAVQTPELPPAAQTDVNTTPTAPAVSDFGAVFALMRKIDDLAAAVRQVQITQTEAAVGLRYLNDKLDLIAAQIARLNTELGVGATVLDGLAAAPADDAVRN